MGIPKTGVVLSESGPVPMVRGSRKQFDCDLRACAQQIGIQPERVHWKETSFGEIELHVEGYYSSEKLDRLCELATMHVPAIATVSVMRGGPFEPVPMVDGKEQRWGTYPASYPEADGEPFFSGSHPLSAASSTYSNLGPGKPITLDSLRETMAKIIERNSSETYPKPVAPPLNDKPAALPKWRAISSMPNHGGGQNVEMCTHDRDWSRGWPDRYSTKDFAIVPWQWADEQMHRSREQEIAGGAVRAMAQAMGSEHGAHITCPPNKWNSIPVTDLARAVLLAPDATREQVENRIAALMTEPLTICGEYRDGWEAADRRMHEANAALERCLDERARLETRLNQALATVAEQEIEIRALKRRSR